MDPPTLQRKRKTALTTDKSSSGLMPTNTFFVQALFSPDATDEPQQQEEREHWSQAGQTSKHPVDCQRHNQDVATPPPVSQVSPYIAAHHHSLKKQQWEYFHCCQFVKYIVAKITLQERRRVETFADNYIFKKSTEMLDWSD